MSKIAHVNYDTISQTYDEHPKDACSQLILLSNNEYKTGLERMQTAIAQARTENRSITFETFFRIRMWHGFKPTA